MVQSRATPRDHALTFYDDDADLVAVVSDYVLEGLRCGEAAIVVATAEHGAAIERALVESGVDVGAQIRDGRYVVLDAHQLVATLTVDERPDRQIFLDHVGDLLARARAHGSRPHVFGEMVALLWAEGNVLGALALESLWNEVAQREDFSLLCAYPVTDLADSALADVGRICGLHSHVQPPHRYDAVEPVTEAAAVHGDSEHGYAKVFIAADGAVSAARRFVARVLGRWGADDDLLADAALVISELATNAICHGDSPFRVRVSDSGAAIRLEVEDAGPGWPRQRAATSVESDGRGMEIVAALSQRTGCRPLAHGKAAWADLPWGRPGVFLPRTRSAASPRQR